MKRYIFYIIISILSLGAAAQAATPKAGYETKTMECGTLFTIEATPIEGYRFVSWDDGSTDSIRVMEAHENAVYIAFFASKCAEWANWPVIVLYDWLLMLDVKTINSTGYFFDEKDVTWYRVVGEQDSIEAEIKDDEVVGTGYYLTLEQSFKNTGDYYAEVDISASGIAYVCHDVMRSVLVHYAGTEPEHVVQLWPNMAMQGGTMKLVGLDPDEETQISVYSTEGHLMESFTVTGESTWLLRAGAVGGCYHVHVSSPSVETVLKYVVYAK